MLSELKKAISASAIGPPVEPEPGTVSRRYRLDPGFPAFAGHFPGYPLLPAVVQILLAACLIEERAGLSLRMTAVETAKFNRQVRPGQEIEVRCRELVSGGVTRWDARLIADGVPAASFTLAFSPAGDAP